MKTLRPIAFWVAVAAIHVAIVGTVPQSHPYSVSPERDETIRTLATVAQIAFVCAAIVLALVFARRAHVEKFRVFGATSAVAAVFVIVFVAAMSIVLLLQSATPYLKHDDYGSLVVLPLVGSVCWLLCIAIAPLAAAFCHTRYPFDRQAIWSGQIWGATGSALSLALTLHLPGDDLSKTTQIVLVVVVVVAAIVAGYFRAVAVRTIDTDRRTISRSGLL